MNMIYATLFDRIIEGEILKDTHLKEETLAEALCGGIGVTNRYSLPLIRELVDEHLLIEEEEIRAAMLYASGSLSLLLEGGGAVALAAVLGHRYPLGSESGRGDVAVVLSGGNVSFPRLQRLMEPDEQA